MMRIDGHFNQTQEPAVTLDFGSIPIEVLIDTGFGGSLIIPKRIATDLILHFEGVEEFYTATGQLFVTPAYTGSVDWFGAIIQVPIAVSAEVKDALLGSQMLQGCRLTIDYAERTVQIQKSA